MSYCDDYQDGCCYNPEDFLENYEVKIREIMTEAANVKIKSQLEELEKLKADNKQLQESYYTARRELSQINRETEQKIKQVIAETTLEVERTLGLDFAVGDTVYFTANDSKKRKCEKCNSGKVDVEVLGVKTTVSCPFCSYGSIVTPHYQPKSGVINSIKFYISTPGDYKRRPGVVHDGNTEYYIDRVDRTFNRSKLYKTLEECQAVCDMDNAAAEERALKKAKVGGGCGNGSL